MVATVSRVGVVHPFGYECAPATPAPLLTVIGFGHLEDDRRDEATLFGYYQSALLQTQETAPMPTGVGASTARSTR